MSDSLPKAVIRVDYDEKAGTVFHLVSLDPPSQWVQIDNDPPGDATIRIFSTEGGSVELAFVPGEGLSAITGLSFTDDKPTATGTYPPFSWVVTEKALRLTDDTSVKRAAAWDCEFSGNVHFGGSFRFDPKIYNEGTDCLRAPHSTADERDRQPAAAVGT